MYTFQPSGYPNQRDGGPTPLSRTRGGGGADRVISKSRASCVVTYIYMCEYDLIISSSQYNIPTCCHTIVTATKMVVVFHHVW